MIAIKTILASSIFSIVFIKKKRDGEKTTVKACIFTNYTKVTFSNI